MKYVNGSFKTPRDTEGYKNDCPDYDPCPLCYGCRNAGMHSSRCDTLCAGNTKKNICNRKLHTPKNIGMMVQRNKITIQKESS